jgi:hypothetical protein
MFGNVSKEWDVVKQVEHIWRNLSQKRESEYI